MPCIRGMGSSPKSPPSPRRSPRAGAVWIGPSPKALTDLGDKITARRVATRAKVPPVPGLSESATDIHALFDFAHTHGFPIMMKRTDGGGGHGITIVRTTTSCAAST